MVARWGPTAIGLGVIPFIVRPIDSAVHYGMDHSVRRLLDRAVDDGGVS